MQRVSAVLNGEEIQALHAMRERIRAARPTERGIQMDVHFATEDALLALASLGSGNIAAHQDFTQVGTQLRNGVAGR